MIKVKILRKEQLKLNEQEEETKKREVIAWKNSRWMFLDTETTGLPPDKKHPERKDPRVVQIGYTIVDNMEVVKVFNKLVDPGADVEIDPAAVNITGIDRQALIDAKAENFLSVIEEMLKDIESCSVIMAYNGRFDKPVVEREFKIANVELPQKSWLDPLIWVRRHLQLPAYNLKAVSEYYKISLDKAHDAGADSEAAARVTMAFVQAFDGLPDDADEVVRLQGVWNKEYMSALGAVRRAKRKTDVSG